MPPDYFIPSNLRILLLFLSEILDLCGARELCHLLPSWFLRSSIVLIIITRRSSDINREIVIRKKGLNLRERILNRQSGNSSRDKSNQSDTREIQKEDFLPVSIWRIPGQLLFKFRSGSAPKILIFDAFRYILVLTVDPGPKILVHVTFVGPILFSFHSIFDLFRSRWIFGSSPVFESP